MAQRSKSSKRWLQEHFRDPFVKQAQAQGYRSRAAFKLKEILEKDKLFKKGLRVLDVGAAPGGWTQVISEMNDGSLKIWALDLLAMPPLPGVTFIQGDLTDETVFERLWQAMGEEGVDLMLSDMAPNMSGIPAVDQARVMYLAEWVLEMSSQLVKPGGSLLIKLFQGEGYDAYLRDFRQVFEKVAIRKPEASRKRSNELYLLGVGRK